MGGGWGLLRMRDGVGVFEGGGLKNNFFTRGGFVENFILLKAIILKKRNCLLFVV